MVWTIQLYFFPFTLIKHNRPPNHEAISLTIISKDIPYLYYAAYIDSTIKDIKQTCIDISRARHYASLSALLGYFHNKIREYTSNPNIIITKSFHTRFSNHAQYRHSSTREQIQSLSQISLVPHIYFSLQKKHTCPSGQKGTNSVSLLLYTRCILLSHITHFPFYEYALR